ncbi:MAG: hypothetical protein ACD_22C00166G0003 [uncultured bacterium]|nr:MAG: hypothetical protein ACD_22C00166G0003 [uncultured bacterium]
MKLSTELLGELAHIFNEEFGIKLTPVQVKEMANLLIFWFG